MHIKFLLLGAVIPLLPSCSSHFISDSKERAEMEQVFNIRLASLQSSGSFEIFSQEMTNEENEALQFMYAYMPLGDIADYPGEYHLNNVRAALKARHEMPWGKDIPDAEFRHFVLPYRINNENLDNARQVFYDELKERVKDLSLKEAVLEII